MLYGSNLLKLIQSFSFASHYFGVGRIGKERNGCRDFTIGSLDQIITKVIPHFDKYPLKTNKYSDYLLFKQVVMMMQRGEHLTAEGLQKIIGIRASLNRGLTPLLLEAFPNTVALLVLRVVMVVLKESKLHKRGSRVVLLFVVTQHIRDELLLKSLVDFFGCVGEASKLILIKIILSSDVNHSKIIMKRFYLFSINTLSLALNLRISKIELK
ncbi:unnamed protein product [Fusarium graminearum]|uniref:Homing endonuclease LAGLIDADG domain-containing protein n=1 Tax=Gibberella zeae TaxID=5518 RepID=A0A4E9EL05_GIBZA|nr:unnamed protein product [Fusarium graminearum]CAF3469189.1 unnamed protein product [Fusarium graminearum]CAF3568578.1 unnamed protein product [Fusarium graminearum]CAF3568750.1 unnamed protein product [Fusarium graminearum]CAF3648168.1 unnamed protein product [Fusarium graminearum]